MPTWASALEIGALLLLLVTYGLLWRVRAATTGSRLIHLGIVLVAFSHAWFLLARQYPAQLLYPFGEVALWSITLAHSIGVAVGLVCVSLGFRGMFRSMWATDARLRRTVEELELVNARLGELSATDELTGVFNHRFFTERLRVEISVATRQEIPLSCAIVDIDHFKAVNDTRGHDCGDRLLAAVASSIRESLRPSDAVGRLGGDEFGVLLPGTDYERALLVAERVRSALDARLRPDRSDLPSVTVSVGIASFPEEDVTEGEQLLKLADEAMYLAKKQGRDRVCTYRPADGGET